MAFAAAVLSASGSRGFNFTNHCPVSPTNRGASTGLNSGARTLPAASASTSTSNTSTSAASASVATGKMAAVAAAGGISNMFSTNLSSFPPCAPASPVPNATSATINGASVPPSPQMIRCSTCNCLVALLDLSDHVCQAPASTSTSASASTSNVPAARPPQQPHHGRLGSGWQPPARGDSASPRKQQQQQNAQGGRGMLNPLRVDVGRPLQQRQHHDAPFSGSSRIPFPRTPSDRSQHSVSPSPSPAASPVGGLPSSYASASNSNKQQLSPAYPYGQSPNQGSSSQRRQTQQQQAEMHHPSSPIYIGSPSRTHAHSPNHPTPTPTYSPSASDLSAENNAGIGARMPFFEKYQAQRRVYAGYGDGSLSPVSPAHSASSSVAPSPRYDQQNGRLAGGANGGQRQLKYAGQARLSPTAPSSTWGQHAPPHSASSQERGYAEQARRTREQQQQQDDATAVPKSPISPGWSGLASQPYDDYDYFTQNGGDESCSPPKHAADEGEHSSSLRLRAMTAEKQVQQQQQQHVREKSESEESNALSNSYSETLDYFIKDGETPDTSPEFPDMPVFKRTEAGRAGEIEVTEEQEEHDGYDGDDIIDSYPTPTPHFSGRFGGLVMDEDAQDDYLAASSRGVSPVEQQQQQQQLALSFSLTHPSLLRTQSDRQAQPHTHQDGQQGVVAHATRSLARGMPMSHSTPQKLSDLAAGRNESPSKSGSKGESAIPFPPLRRRIISEERAVASSSSSRFAPEESLESPAASPAEESGSGLDACMDDLLREMNRSSLDTLTADVGAGPRSSMMSFDSPIVPQGRQRTRSNHAHCDSCNSEIKTGNPVERDGQNFCSECYAQLYLPKCRKCRLPIEDKAIGSGDGKVKGKFHVGCFACFSCSAPFPTGDFYVFGNRPYCGLHYHERNGTLCANAACGEEQKGIEGPCVSLVGEEGGNGGRYHPACFKCSEIACSVLLDQYHYVLAGLPYCEQHAREIEDRDNASSSNSSGATRSVSPPSNHSHNDSSTSDSSVPPEAERRRSASLDIPAQSLNALRKNAHSPNYRAAVSRRRSAQRKNSVDPSAPAVPPPANLNQQRQPYQHGAYQQTRNNGPPPACANRRAAKRRTVISHIGLR